MFSKGVDDDRIQETTVTVLTPQGQTTYPNQTMPNRTWQDVPIKIDLTVPLGTPVSCSQNEEGAGSRYLIQFHQADTFNMNVAHYLIYILSPMLDTNTLVGAQCWNYYLFNYRGLVQSRKRDSTN